MYRIALCDNDPLFLRRVELAIVDYNRAHPNTTPYQVTKYTSPARLLLDIQSGELYDAFLLEVTLHEMNSIALAAKIREISPIAVILFLSARTEFRFVQESFKVQALRYLSKLSLDATLPEVLSATEKQLERLKPAFFTYPYYSEVIRIAYTEILYLQKIKRMIVFYTASKGGYHLKRPLISIYEQLNDRRFFYADQSTIVNIDHIIGASAATVTLDNGAEIPVSRKMMSALKSELLRLWGGEGRQAK